jgi:hypothetical protein
VIIGLILPCAGDRAAHGGQFSSGPVGILQALAGTSRVYNVRNYGASANNAALNVAVRDGSSDVVAVSNPAAGGFTVGQSVALLHAGPPASVGIPQGLRAAAMTYRSNGSVSLQGCRSDARNLGCTAVWTWQVVAVDSRGGSSGPSAPVTVKSAPLRPNPTNLIQLVWNSDVRASGYLVYGCQGSGCLPTLRAVLPNNWYRTPNGEACRGCKAPSFMNYAYIGHAFGIDEIAGKQLPRLPRNQMLFGRIDSINGRTIRLSAPARTSATVRMLHDDSPAFQAAIDQARRRTNTTGSNGGIVLIPPGQYPLARTIMLDQSSNIRLAGISSEGNSNGTQLIWHGGAGGIVISLNQARDATLENFAVTDENSGSTPGVILDIDIYDAGTGIKTLTTSDAFRNLSLQRSGVAVRIGNRSSGNCEMMRFDNLFIGSPWNGEGGWYGYYIAGSGQTYEERIDGGSIGRRDAAVYVNAAGSIDTYGLNLTHNLVDWYINAMPFDHIVEVASDSEGAAQHLYAPYPSMHAMRVSIFGSRLVTDGPEIASNNLYMVDNSSAGLMLVSNQIRRDTDGQCKLLVSTASASQPAPLLSVENYYADNHPFVTPPGVRLALFSAGDIACRINSNCSVLQSISPSLDTAAARLLSSLASLPIRGSIPSRPR